MSDPHRQRRESSGLASCRKQLVFSQSQLDCSVFGTQDVCVPYVQVSVDIFDLQSFFRMAECGRRWLTTRGQPQEMSAKVLIGPSLAKSVHGSIRKVANSLRIFVTLFADRERGEIRESVSQKQILRPRWSDVERACIFTLRIRETSGATTSEATETQHEATDNEAVDYIYI